MKKIIYKLTYLTALFAFIYSCDDVERVYYMMQQKLYYQSQIIILFLMRKMQPMKS